ncbi:hypothetical protein OROGR_029177 [Orobanche gracilis]
MVNPGTASVRVTLAAELKDNKRSLLFGKGQCLSYLMDLAWQLQLLGTIETPAHTDLDKVDIIPLRKSFPKDDDNFLRLSPTHYGSASYIDTVRL